MESESGGIFLPPSLLSLLLPIFPSKALMPPLLLAKSLLLPRKAVALITAKVSPRTLRRKRERSLGM